MIPYFEHKMTILQSRREIEIFEFPLHMHTSAEFIYINEGQLQILFPDQSFTLLQGDFAIIFPHTIHGYASFSSEVDYTIAISRSDVYGDFESVLLENHPKIPIIAHIDLPKDIPLLMNELVSLNDCEQHSALIKAIVSLILARTLPLLQLATNTEKYESMLSVKAVTYVATHFKENISLDSMADFLGISRFKASRLFSSIIRISFVKYVNFIRINYAKDLLENTSNNVIDIALDCGFGTLRTFNRTFKEHTGVTPFQYRSCKRSSKKQI